MTCRRLALAVALLAMACLSDFPSALGEQCDLNSDCATPLVCQLGFCRKECSTSRDCAVGLDCLQTNDGLGVCQLPSDTRCVRDSDCFGGLVCTSGECTNECACEPEEPCRDCPPGASCISRPEGSRACLDTATQTCVRNSDCDATDTSFVCAPDQRCRVECRVNQDCRFDAICAEVMFEEPGSGVVMGQFCVDPLRLPAAADAGATVDAANPGDAGAATDGGGAADGGGATDGG